MAHKKKTAGQILAEARWKKTTPEERAIHGRKLTDARLAKRSKVEPSSNPHPPATQD